MCNVEDDTMSFNATNEGSNADHQNGENIPISYGKAKKAYEFKICGKKCNSLSIFKVHMKIHTNEKLHLCGLCDKRFRESGQLKLHQRLNHLGEKPFQCKICETSFGQVVHLLNHEAIHSEEKPFPCEFCKKRFRRQINLNNHIKIHTNEKPYFCQTCSKSFSRSDNLKTHISAYHEREKLFQCKKCSASFSYSSSLKAHERSHTGKKPFQCKTCQKCFAEPNKLK